MPARAGHSAGLPQENSLQGNLAKVVQDFWAAAAMI
jgi:hypothetical protein